MSVNPSMTPSHLASSISALEKKNWRPYSKIDYELASAWTTPSKDIEKASHSTLRKIVSCLSATTRDGALSFLVAAFPDAGESAPDDPNEAIKLDDLTGVHYWMFLRGPSLTHGDFNRWEHSAQQSPLWRGRMGDGCWELHHLSQDLSSSRSVSNKNTPPTELTSPYQTSSFKSRSSRTYGSAQTTQHLHFGMAVIGDRPGGRLRVFRHKDRGTWTTTVNRSSRGTSIHYSCDQNPKLAFDLRRVDLSTATDKASEFPERRPGHAVALGFMGSRRYFRQVDPPRTPAVTSYPHQPPSSDRLSQARSPFDLPVSSQYIFGPRSSQQHASRRS